MRREERAVDLAVPPQHMGDGESERRIAAGKGLEMQMAAAAVGCFTGSTTTILAEVSRIQCLC